MGRVCYEAFRAARLADGDLAVLDWPRLTPDMREAYRAAADGVLLMADLGAGDSAGQRAAGGAAEAGT